MFTIVIPYYDTNSSYRLRNLFKVIRNYKSIAPEFDIIIVEQNGNGQLEDIIEDEYKCKYLNVRMDYHLFHKTRLLNYAIDNCESEYIIMADADCIVTPTAIQSLKNEYSMGSIVYPFNSVDYYNEAHTRKLIGYTPVEKSYKVDRGLPLKRFTGMINCFSRSTHETVGKFDEDIIGWGSEDDVFLMKCERLVSPSYRTQLDSPLIHLFHPKSDTDDYKKSNQFMKNKKISALIKRMDIDDLKAYTTDSSTLSKFIDKYEASNKLSLIIKWKFKNVVVAFDSTIYDMETFDNLSVGKILRTIYDVDGYDFMMSIVKEIHAKVSDLDSNDINEINECIAMCPKSHCDLTHPTTDK